MSATSATIAMSIDTLLPAFDEMREAFSMAADDNRIAQTITALLVGLAVGQLVWGPVSDRFGRKVTLYAGLAVVIVGSLGATLAPSFGFLMMCRLLIGFGVAGPRAISLAITRDCYSGDAMARITAMVTAVFLIVPIVAPVFGELLVRTLGWRSTHAAGGVLALVVAVWQLRLRETLDPSDRRPLSFGPMASVAREALSSRMFVAFSLAQLFAYGAFFPWLGSSELIIGQLYDRPGQFALLFGLNALVMGIGISLVARNVDRIGASRIIVWTSVGQVIVGGVGWILATQTSGLPPFAAFFAVVTLAVTLNAMGSPLISAKAMEPVGHFAGTAASMTGFVVFSGGAILAALVDARISDAVTPFFVGFFIYNACLVACILIGNRADQASASSVGITVPGP